MPAKPRSLADYANSKPSARGETCWVCGIKERGELDSMYGKLTDNGKQITATVIHGYLLERCGYKKDVATLAKLHYHFGKMKHHEG